MEAKTTWFWFKNDSCVNQRCLNKLHGCQLTHCPSIEKFQAARIKIDRSSVITSCKKKKISFSDLENGAKRGLWTCDRFGGANTDILCPL